VVEDPSPPGAPRRGPIREDGDTELAKLPFKESALNEAWLEIAVLAYDLIVWTPARRYRAPGDRRSQR
jgi:hypothetical protein